MLARVLEPEVMDSAQEAADYDAMDHGAVNASFCADLLAFAPDLTTADARVLDVGTGSALIPIELCARTTHLAVVAIDLSDGMLALAKRNVDRAGLDGRISLTKVDAKGTSALGTFDATVSNSIVHHIPSPSDALSEMWARTKPGGVLFVRDLFRPATDEALRALVLRYRGTPPEEAAARACFDRQEESFRASLAAALTVDEVRAIVAPLGIAAEAVSATSDRHWTLATRKA